MYQILFCKIQIFFELKGMFYQWRLTKKYCLTHLTHFEFENNNKRLIISSGYIEIHITL